MDTWLNSTLTAIEGQQWWLVASSIVVAATWAFRALVARRAGPLAWFATDRGGVLAAAIVTIAGGFAHATAAGQAPDRAFVITSLEVFLGAVGQYATIRRLLAPRPAAPAQLELRLERTDKEPQP